MITEIEIPNKVPVMILRGVTLFPHCILPLHIFEKRYQEMLQFSLETDRMFAVAGLDQQKSIELDQEIPFSIATVGLIKMSKKGEDNLSNLVLQGLTRVRLSPTSHEYSFPYMETAVLRSELGATTEELQQEKENLLKIVSILAQRNSNIPQDIISFLQNIEELESLVDLAAYAFIQKDEVKQKILELTKVKDKYVMLKLQLLQQINQTDSSDELL